ncbi:MAG TPA: hypothetical protein VGN42_17555 [Pirellulales bacterium]|nr:hypothetical protein [Pirellulales bacterium]
MPAPYLHIPVIGIARVRSVFDPDPSLDINVSSFSLLGTVRHGLLLDDPLTPFVLFELRLERGIAACRQSGLLDLPFNFSGLLLHY